ncbi:class I SAM-dependent methyltransferase [Aliarcobacter trophiarum]|nr:class I SAM-dependent methyltransferase [Aliarcobacter trophiarum]
MFLEDFKNKVIKTELVEKCQCGSLNLEELTKIDRFGLPFGSLICRDCGLVMTNPRMSQESLSYYYDKYYHPLNYGEEHLENQVALFEDGQGKKIFTIIKDFLPKKEKISVLEIGAGTGNVLSEFKEEAKKENIIVEELGTEYNNNCINKCKEKSINTIFGNIQTVIGLNKKFDLIILSHVFEHFIDLNKELDDLKQLMVDKTLLYVEVPGLFVIHEKDYYNNSFLGYHIHAHMFNFNKDSLNNLMHMSGFESKFINEKVESVYSLKHNINGSIQNNFIKNSYSKVLNYLELLSEGILTNFYKTLKRWHETEKSKREKYQRWNQQNNKKLEKICIQYDKVKRASYIRKISELKELFKILGDLKS